MAWLEKLHLRDDLSCFSFFKKKMLRWGENEDLMLKTRFACLQTLSIIISLLSEWCFIGPNILSCFEVAVKL